MTKNKITAKELAAVVDVSPTQLSYATNNKRQPNYKLLDSLANAQNVSTDRLTGEAASCIIEDRLNEIGMSLEDVAEKTGISAPWLRNLDAFTSRQFTDYEMITRVAEAIGLLGSTLRAALARQEIPAKDPYDSDEADLITTYRQISNTTIKIPILGTIRAGLLLLAEENQQSEVEVPAGLKADFALKITGDSISWAGISDGNIAVMRQNNMPSHGMIVAVGIEDGDW